MRARRERLIAGWIEGSVIAIIGVTAAATLPLGAPGACAAVAKRLPASSMLNNACIATVGAPAFRVHGHFTEGKTAVGVDIYFGSVGTLVTYTQHRNQTINLIVDASKLYMKANEPFWQSQGSNSQEAATEANRWFDATSEKSEFATLTKDLSRQKLVNNCEDGSATYVGTASVNGVKAIKIHFLSNQESDTYYVKTGPHPYLLRVAGSSTKKGSGGGDLLFSDYDVQPDTAPPPGAISLPGGGGSTGSTGNIGNSGNSGNSGNTGN